MGQSPRDVVRNAADVQQVKAGRQREKELLRQQRNDLSVVLGTTEGRRVLWRLLEHCKTFGSVWHPSALIHYNAGQQDVGHFLLSEITQASPDALLLMMRENRTEEDDADAR